MLTKQNSLQQRCACKVKVEKMFDERTRRMVAHVPCKFFATTRGCRRGSKCDFLHEDPNDNAVESDQEDLTSPYNRKRRGFGRSFDSVESEEEAECWRSRSRSWSRSPLRTPRSPQGSPRRSPLRRPRSPLRRPDSRPCSPKFNPWSTPSSRSPNFIEPSPQSSWDENNQSRTPSLQNFWQMTTTPERVREDRSPSSASFSTETGCERSSKRETHLEVGGGSRATTPPRVPEQRKERSSEQRGGLKDRL